jgi:hypothetical protein
MIKVKETTPQDVKQIREWIAADPFHAGDERWSQPELMMTGHGMLSCCVQDDMGPVFYMKLQEDGDYVRVIVQFGPETAVSKRRVIKALVYMAIPIMKGFAEGSEKRGVVFESYSPELIRFMDKQGFKPVEGSNDFRYEGKQDV